MSFPGRKTAVENARAIVTEGAEHEKSAWGRENTDRVVAE